MRLYHTGLLHSWYTSILLCVGLPAEFSSLKLHTRTYLVWLQYNTIGYNGTGSENWSERLLHIVSGDVTAESGDAEIIPSGPFLN